MDERTKPALMAFELEQWVDLDEMARRLSREFKRKLGLTIPREVSIVT